MWSAERLKASTASKGLTLLLIAEGLILAVWHITLGSFDRPHIIFSL